MAFIVESLMDTIKPYKSRPKNKMSEGHYMYSIVDGYY